MKNAIALCVLNICLTNAAWASTYHPFQLIQPNKSSELIYIEQGEKATDLRVYRGSIGALNPVAVNSVKRGMLGGIDILLADDTRIELPSKMNIMEKPTISKANGAMASGLTLRPVDSKTLNAFLIDSNEPAKKHVSESLVSNPMDNSALHSRNLIDVSQSRLNQVYSDANGNRMIIPRNGFGDRGIRMSNTVFFNPAGTNNILSGVKNGA